MKVVKSSWLREDPFFEISGMSGRLYLESFAFGEVENPINLLGAGGGSVGLTEESPLTLVPDSARKGSSSLLRHLNRFRSDPIVYDVAEKIGTCSIGAEWKNGGRVVTTTVYLFFKCDLARLRLFGAGDIFRIEFGRLQRVVGFLTKRSW